MNQIIFNKQIFTPNELAAKIIKSGGVVDFPTETDYGLGVDAFNPNCVKKYF